MEQAEVVRKFVDSLGKFDPPKITASVMTGFLEGVVVDSESLEEFICYSDRYLKHTRTFQLSFLIHSLASVLTVSPTGAVSEVLKNVKTNVFDIPVDKSLKLGELEGAKRYDDLCAKLMDFESEEAQRLEKRFMEARLSGEEKLDDGSEPNQVFDPMKSNFPNQGEVGEDLTEELEVKERRSI